ncbi:MAG: GGDEF domain-containing protein, partial [Lysobacteraceae bacterium]
LVVPLRVPAPGWGALVAPLGGRRLLIEDRDALAELARVAMLHLDEAQAACQLRHTAERDALTGTLNRRTLDLLVVREFKLASSQPLSVLFIDIDWFKRVNDTHGHACGDECLRRVATALRGALRPADSMGRYGGEEFLVLLPGQDGASARVAAERLRQAVERMPVAWQDDVLQLTVSIGLATRRDGDGQPANLLARADKALYRAKHEGRNRVCAASAYVE